MENYEKNMLRFCQRHDIITLLIGHLLIAERSCVLDSSLEEGSLKFKHLNIAPKHSSIGDYVSDSPAKMREQTNTSIKKTKTLAHYAG